MAVTTSPRKVTPELEPQVAALVRDGWGATRIKKWLLDEHQISISVAALHKTLKRLASESTRRAEALVQAELAPQIVGDLERLERIRRNLQILSNKVRLKKRPGYINEYCKLTDLEVRVIEKKISLAKGDGNREDRDKPQSGGMRVFIPPERTE